MLLGFADFGIAFAYVMCFLSVGLCALYGYINWNKDDDSGDGK